MKKELSISIIVPCYNQGEYLDECLQSVLKQTYKNWECIIVNDGSVDNTEEIAKNWIDRDFRFKYIKKENGGLSSARNFGIDIAKSDWILPLDADDKIGNKYLELAQKEFNKGYTIIYSKACFFGEVNKEWKLAEYSYDRLLCYNHIYCSAFFKKESWKSVGGYDSNLNFGREDWEFWISILEKGSKVKLIDYEGFFYRRKLNSMDVSINKDISKKEFSETYIYKKHLDKYLKYNKNPIINYKIVCNKVDQLNSHNKKINKNFFTRLLFKIIKIIS